MTIQVGNMDTRVRIEQKSVTQDSTYGTEVITWIPLATVWAEVTDVLPSRQQAEQTREQLQVATQRTRIRMRYRTDVDSTMRCVIGGIVWQIVSGPAEIGDRHTYMELVAERYSS
jgi:SPP1 family predicted phage head-tail adaptor